jgi:hypothetical protein
VLDRFDFLTRIRLPRRTATAGLVALGALALSIALFFAFGNGRARRVLFFPRDDGRGVLAEERFLPNRHGLEGNLHELVDGEILGPTRQDASLLFPRDMTVRGLFVRSRVLYLDISPELVLAGPGYPLTGKQAIDLLTRSIRFNFPGVRDVVLTIDGQAPRFAEKNR